MRGPFAMTVVFMLLTVSLTAMASASQNRVDGPGGADRMARFSTGPDFVENMGQITDPDVMFHSGDVYLMRDGILIRAFPSEGSPVSGSHIVKLGFADAREVGPQGADLQTFYSNYLEGRDPEGWISRVPHYGTVIYEDLYDGVDMVFKMDPRGLKYEFVVEPGADPSRIGLEVMGAGAGTDGRVLSIETSVGTLLDDGLMAYHVGEPDEPTDVRMVLDNGIVRFDVDHDTARTLVIDPLFYSSFLGSTMSDQAFDMVIDGEERPVLVGTTNSADFPTTTGAYDEGHGGNQDGFVTKFDVNASELIFSTYIGGLNTDQISKVGLGPGGDIIIAGYTSSADFPVTAGAMNETFDPVMLQTPFAARLSSDGTTLAYSTFVGGSGSDSILDMHVKSDGHAYIIGTTQSVDFPVTSGTYCETIAGSNGAVFILNLKPDGSDPEVATFVDGTFHDTGRAVTLDASGNIYFGADTTSSDFPTTTGSYCETMTGSSMVVGKLDPTMSDLLFATYFGGDGTDNVDDIAVNGSGHVFLMANTNSRDMPVSGNAFEKNYNDGGWGWEPDVFVVKFEPDLSDIIYATYIGSPFEDQGLKMGLDQMGNVHFTGYATSGDYPVSNDAHDRYQAGEEDAIYTVLNATGTGLIYSTFIGGSAFERGRSFVRMGDNSTIIAGWTGSAEFETTDGAYDTGHDGGNDAFILRLMLPIVPDPPEGLTAEAVNKKVMLEWEPPLYDGGTNILEYRLYKGTSEDQVSYLKAVGGLTYDDTAVTNGNTYYYAVSALNWKGEGALSPIVNATPGAPPGIPSGPSLVSGNGFINFSWHQPYSDGGSPITGYNVGRGPEALLVAPFASLGNVTYLNDTNVTNGEVYYYTVSAVNVKGQGEATFPLDAIAGSTPSAPTNLTIAKGDANVFIRWKAPLENGGFDLLSYLVLRGPTPLALSAYDAINVTEHYMDTVVTNGEIYCYAVAAENDMGLGPMSLPVCAKPGFEPSVPRNLTYGDGEAFVHLHWLAPENNSRLDVTYRVYRGLSPDAMELLVETNDTDHNDTTVLKGKRYYFAVSAYNSIGEGPRTEQVRILIEAYPTAPVLYAVPGNGTVKLTWELLDSPVAINKYHLYRGEYPDELDLLLVGTFKSTIDRNVQNGLTYYYAISGESDKGEGPLSNIVEATPASMPGPVVGLKATAIGKNVTLGWFEPEDMSTTYIRHYVVYRGVAENQFDHIANVTNLSFVDTSVEYGMTYYYTVRAYNGIELGVQAPPVLARPATVPDAPKDLKIAGSRGRAVLTWAAPGFDGGMDITEYKIFRSSDADFILIGSVTTAEYTDTAVDAGAKYEYCVVAVNLMGDGNATMPVEVYIPSEPASVDMDTVIGIIAAVIVVSIVVAVLVFRQMKRRGP